jgi:CRISPR-associated protein Cst1
MAISYYPSSWYYNACVHGFLEILANELGSEFLEERILQEDGTLLLDDSVLSTLLECFDCYPHIPVKIKPPSGLPDLKRLAWWWVTGSMKVKGTEDEPWSDQEKLDKTVSSYFVGNKGFYVNLVQPRDDKAIFLNQWFTGNNSDKAAINCSFCGQAFAINEQEKEYYHYLTSAISSIISSSTAFPNLFFDGQPVDPICRQCRWPLICFHLVNPNGLFVNTGSFLLNWHLNKLLSRQSSFSATKYSRLVDSLFNESRLRAALGAWGLQGIEVVLFDIKGIKNYVLSSNLTRLLLNPAVAGPLRRISNARIYDIFFSERFAEFSYALYTGLRKSVNTSGIAVYELRELQSIAILYGAILNLNKGDEKMDSMRLISYGKSAPIRVREKNKPNNADLNLVFRLLELTRNNHRSEAYHLLLRKYIVSGMQFPGELSKVFIYDDPEMFKNGIFTYITGITGQSQE